MIRDFDKRFADLIDESVPRVILESKEERRYNKKSSGKTVETDFVKNYCAEY